MVELVGMGIAAAAGTVALVVALLPRKWLPATGLSALFVPVLLVCASMIGSRIAMGGLSGETDNAVGELDLWLLGLALFDAAVAVLCVGRVLLWVKAIMTRPSGRALNR